MKKNTKHWMDLTSVSIQSHPALPATLPTPYVFCPIVLNWTKVFCPIVLKHNLFEWTSGVSLPFFTSEKLVLFKPISRTEPDLHTLF